MDRFKILFVCMGNICRSPLAEGIFRHIADNAGRAAEFDIESAGTGGWHQGNPPDPRSIAVAAAHASTFRPNGRAASLPSISTASI
jgi:protein-tyrosine phosphatase